MPQVPISPDIVSLTDRLSLPTSARDISQYLNRDDISGQYTKYTSSAFSTSALEVRGHSGKLTITLSETIEFSY